MENLETVFTKIKSLLASNTEWLLIHLSGAVFALQSDEIELNFDKNKILIGFLDEKGFQTWRVTEFVQKNNEIVLDLSRNFSREQQKIRLVPRLSADELSASVILARLEKANQLAAVIKEHLHGEKLVRVSLNKENGRYARIVFETLHGSQSAFMSDVSETATPEILLSNAIWWLSKLERRMRKPIEEINILAEKKLLKRLQKLHALLAENWRRKIKLWEISRSSTGVKEHKIIAAKNLTIADLWREKAGKLQLPENLEISRTAREIIKFAPDKIDLLFTKHGETLRFEGLPFARIRKTPNVEKCWFGIERERHILNERSRDEFFDLLENLNIYRRFDTPNSRHAFFQLAPEAWLEAVLRRNVKKLDANLILSPVYTQFRAEHDKIDLLALRKDGRLIIIQSCAR